MTSDVIVAFVSGVLGPVILLVVKSILEKKGENKKDLVKDTLKASELINFKIETVKEIFGADRVWIAQFHNGGNFYPTGKSMAKFSFIYEVVNAGIPSIQSYFQNIPVNLFSKPINELLENETIKIPDFDDPTVATFGLKYIAESNGTKSSYLFAIKSLGDKFVGVLGVDFVKEKVYLEQDDVNSLSNHATSLGGAILDS